MDRLAAQTSFSLSSVVNLTAQCLSSTLAKPTLFGAEILTVTSSLVTNYTAPFFPPTFFNSDPPLYGEATDLSFCNVTVTYTHPGQDDNINVNLWLPLSVAEEVYFNETTDQSTHSRLEDVQADSSPAWNGILLSHGGGGFSTCLPSILSHSALSQGYAISRTDGGHPPMSPSNLSEPTVESWALLSPGNINLYKFQDFASVALHDMAIISKGVVKEFYGVSARYSYFQGCSTGGRQGLMLAQRYPVDYDGILAGAPAIYFPKLLVSHYFGQMMMHSLREYPRACEFEAITKAAIEACDELDGVKDGIVSNEEECAFDPFPMWMEQGEVPCKMKYADEDDEVHERVNISYAAAHIAWHLWGGAKGSVRQPDWHVMTHSTPLTAFAATICFRKNNTCVAGPSSLATDWIRPFLYKDPSLTVEDLAERITLAELVRLFHQSEEEYHSLISTSDPNLSAFAASGGKLLLWHGTSDEAIMPGQTTQYYDSVLEYAKMPYSGIQDVHDFFRLFMAPGVQHCGGGEGVLPINTLRDLRRWVEEGIAPEQLEGQSFSRTDGEKIHRKLCMYPRVARYKGHGDIRKAESFECADSF